LLNLRAGPQATRLRASCCPSPTEGCTQLAFVFVGVGVALPWSSLRSGISFFIARFDAQFYVYLFLVYNIAQLLVLLLQQWDRVVDIRLGPQVTYPFRLILSLALLAGCQIALPWSVGGQASALGVALALGFFDGVAFGSASQLFTHVQRGSAGAYFLGSSLASLAAIGFSYASGFNSLPPTKAGGGAPPELYYFYISCAGASAFALLAVAALLFSKTGRAHLEELDDAFLGSAPSSPRAFIKQQRASSARSGTPTMEVEMALLSGSGGGGNWDAGAPGAPLPPSPARAQPTSAALLWRAAPLHASIFALWTATVAGDSFLGFVPSAGDTRAATSATFRLALVYCSLGGELLGKNVMVFFGMRRARDGDAAGAGGSSLNAAATHLKLRISLRGDEGSEEGGGGGGGGAPLLVPCVTSPQLLLAFSLARLLLLLPPLLLYSLQQVFGPSRGERALPGFFYSDAGVLAYQFAFDASGAFLSSLCYAVLAHNFSDAPESRTLASTQLGLSLTLGSFAGVGVSAALSCLLPAVSL